MPPAALRGAQTGSNQPRFFVVMQPDRVDFYAVEPKNQLDDLSGLKRGFDWSYVALCHFFINPHSRVGNGAPHGDSTGNTLMIYAPEGKLHQGS